MAGLSASALFHLFSTGDRSDFNITSQVRDVKVHKIVICATSHFFDAIAKGNFTVCSPYIFVPITVLDLFSQEHDGVEVQEVSHTILAKVLHFLYLGDYHNDESACSKELHGPNLPKVPI